MLQRYSEVSGWYPSLHLGLELYKFLWDYRKFCVSVRLTAQSATVHSVRNVGGRAAVLLVLCLTAESLLINTCIASKAL